MKLYLVQHAKSKSEQEDPSRPLSEEGLNDANKMAVFLSNIVVNKIYHSGKLRAQQTAEILAKSLKTEIIKANNLEPLANPEIWEDSISKELDDIMIVGHLPHLGKLASLLLDNTPENLVVFQQGGVICLERNDSWMIRWFVTPDLLR